MAKSIMIQGTMSNVGKSLITAGLCRIFYQDGFKTAPFKSQNMALNSFITKEHLEMGRAQAVQADACKIEPDVRMNPILLKPTTDMGSQVVINGEVAGNMRAMEYFKKKKEYIPIVRQAYESLAAEYDIIVIEGAGSPAEINLKQDDIVNMGMAKIADAPVLLAGDIDRGGVFAQLTGTLMLLEKEEQERIQGLIINKFRGDKKILEPGLLMLEERCGKKVVGVVPYLDVEIEEEDSLAGSLGQKKRGNGIDLAVIRLPRISNFTDLQAFTLEPDVSVRYAGKVAELGQPDVILLPGTKNTVKDMEWLRESGLETAILRCHKKGSVVFGICGGFQMLGETIQDAYGVEGGSRICGLGLLPVDTVFKEEKTRTRAQGQIEYLQGSFGELSGKKVNGYEIHMGHTVRKNGAAPFLELKDSFPDSKERETVKEDGCFQGTVFGTYLHGIFDEEEFRSAFVRILCRRKGISYQSGEKVTYQEYKEQQFDKLAQELRNSLDMDRIYRIIEN
ncbi:cobyric acid synthase [bacterium D16-51]|nr:cobyric acid synthase [bacterium D16-59]RKI58915.1 cobyric acid synthase [bacterium D16-51]